MILKRLIPRLPRPQTMLTVVALAGSLFLTTTTNAQSSPEVQATYGRGVHALFANQTADAEQMFSKVVAAGSTDPRVYYFRAIARIRLGQKNEAEEDMRIGAAYEARDPGNRNAIGIALQRIQGPARRTLENFRREGRLQRAQQRRQQTQQRYEQLKRRNPKVLRREQPVQLDQLVDPGQGSVAAPAQPPLEDEPPTLTPDEAAPPADDDDLFSDPAPTTSEDTPAEPAKEEPADDFFDEPAPEEAEADPFGEESPAEETPQPADEDPFGDPAPAESADDPFGDSASSEDAPAEEEPMPAEAEDDPFGAAEQPAAESTDASDDELFGDPAPTESADDPFGEATPSEDAPAEEAEDPFGAASEEAPESLTSSDKVESGKLMGILGRVVNSTNPLRGVSLPDIGPPGAMDSPEVAPDGEFQFGPSDDDLAAPADEEEDSFESNADELFGDPAPETESTDDPFAEGEPSDDPFDSAPLEESTTEEETPGEDNTELPADDDPFSDP